MAKDLCTVPRIERLNPLDLLRDRVFPNNDKMIFATEHIMEINVINRFMETCIDGILPSRSIANTKPINQFALQNAWNREADPGQLPTIGDNPRKSPLTLNDRIYGVLGSNNFPTPFAFLQGALNRKKQSLFEGKMMLGEDRIADIVKHIEREELWRPKNSDQTPVPSDEALLEQFRQVSRAHTSLKNRLARSLTPLGEKIVGTFAYMNEDYVAATLRMVSDYILRETGFAETVYGVAGMQSMWREFEADLFPFVARTAQANFARAMEYAFNRLAKSSAPKEIIKRLMEELNVLELQKGKLTLDLLKN